MGKLALAAKVAHVPSMYLSEQPGQFQGCRQAACDGHREISRRMRELNVDTVVVFDTHWLVNNDFHINSSDRYHGTFTSNEFPHLLHDLDYDYQGHAELGERVAAIGRDKGVKVRAHNYASLDLEYGTIVPMYLMNQDKRFRVLSVAAWCPWHDHQDSRRLGEAVREAIEQTDGTFAILASGSLSHRIHDSGSFTFESFFTISNEFYRQVDLRAVDLWKAGRWKEFTDMLPLYAQLCHGEGMMHDTAMLLGALGWDSYDGAAEIITDYFAAAGTGQINAVLPLPSAA